ncbi:MAG TPA: STAS domain-containing protein [Miltoncostaeaceae bacterium]|nr:STAS domain-containing protein [Miltoncostaeaceae bacterium]
MLSPFAPPAPPFSIAVVPDRQRVVLHPVGELDLLTIPALRREVVRLHEVGFTDVLVDLAGLGFIDSEGVKLLLALRREAVGTGRRVTVAPGPAQVQRVFALTMTLDLLEWETAAGDTR